MLFVECVLWLASRANHEPLFEVPSEEELDVSFDASEDTCTKDNSKGRISSFSSSHGSIESTAEQTNIDYTIPEETQDDIKDVSEKLENIDLQDRTANCEGINPFVTINHQSFCNCTTVLQPDQCNSNHHRRVEMYTFKSVLDHLTLYFWKRLCINNILKLSQSNTLNNKMMHSDWLSFNIIIYWFKWSSTYKFKWCNQYSFDVI